MHLTKLLISKCEGIPEKISFERSVYEWVDEKRI